MPGRGYRQEFSDPLEDTENDGLEQLVQSLNSGDWLAGRPGFEPRSTGPEPVVLPLNYLPSRQSIVHRGTISSKFTGDLKRL